METPEKFYRLRVEKVLTTFHIKLIRDCETLDNLLSSTGTFTPLEEGILDLALERYRLLAEGWNEEELKMHFISAIFTVANINIPSVCKTFFERPLSGIINNYELNIVTDCMVASYNEGGEPVKPYFFLQEFKQSQRFGKTDPQGQMLAAMLLAQEQNAEDKPLYGCYVIEKNWHFTTLSGLNYCRSRQYDSTRKDDLLQIVFILRKLKDLILNR
jgi:hypothetical protein